MKRNLKRKRANEIGDGFRFLVNKLGNSKEKKKKEKEKREKR